MQYSADSYAICAHIFFLTVYLDSLFNVITGYIEPIPALLQGVIEHLTQWRLLPANRKPNSCIINFFDEVASPSLQ